MKNVLGKITVLPDDACCKEYHWVFNIYRMETDHKVATAQAPPYAVEALRATGGKALLDAISYNTVVTVTSKQDVYASLFKVRRGYALNIVNVQDTVTKSGLVSHVAPIPAFVKGAKPIKHDIFVKINMNIPVKKITLHSPERSRCVTIPFVNKNGVLTFTIPKSKFAGYALVKIK